MPPAPLRENRAFKALASLELTLGCLIILMLLVVACTLEQVSLGNYASVAKYFRSAFLYVRVGGLALPWFPAGGAVGAVMLANLLASMTVRLQRRWRKLGLWLCHIGLVLLVLGEFATGLFAHESQMAIRVGQSLNYTESPRADELYVVDASAPDSDTVYAVPASDLRPGRVLSEPGWPFTVKVLDYDVNASIGPRPQAPGLPPSA
ncbi:MAG: hypothetical protein KGL53_00230, partial [Elusimicrobia bacterium]|nr:hypothetical protein [Elusimicrobiota bacterium]